MPRTKKGTPPSYRRHSSGQAVVTVRLADGQRRDLLLGPWDTQASRDEYTRILTTLTHALARRNFKRGIASLCIGGGEAVAVAIERLG